MDGRESWVLCHFVLLSICLSSASTGEPNIGESDLSDARRSETTTANIVGATVQQYRRPRYYRRGYNGRKGDGYRDDRDYDHDHDHDYDADEEVREDSKAISQGKVDYWGSYYDFLINEGSYKFWAIFQLATAALLIYSGFAALYYAKVNPPTTDDYDDVFRRRRKRTPYSPSARDRSLAGFDSALFQRIMDAVERETR